MSHDEDKIKEGHSYDGITEFDNPLPMWWLWTFLLTIIFAFMYFIHYEFGGGDTLQQELKVAMQEIDKMKTSVPQIIESEDQLAKEMTGNQVLALGAAGFAGKCAACHGIHLQGLIGPNLTDKYWLHGKGTRMDIVNVIREGVLEKGMPPWKDAIKKEEIYAITAFVISKKDSHPDGAKPPQGNPTNE